MSGARIFGLLVVFLLPGALAQEEIVAREDVVAREDTAAGFIMPVGNAERGRLLFGPGRTCH